ncbi:MAG: PAS domain-containing protein [Anaerolineae bacterium]|nr:PAS domain-containing protein [Anaerolineae bacterium]
MINLPADVLDDFFRKIPMGVAIYNRDLTLRIYNETWLSYVNSYQGNANFIPTPGMTLADLFPQAATTIQPMLEQALRGETRQQHTLPLSNGQETIYWNTIAFPLTADEVITGVFHVMTDVTPRREAEMELQKAKQSLLTLMGSLPGMAYRGPHNIRREMELVNTGAQELTGYPSENFITPATTPYASIVHDDDRERVQAELETAVADARPFELLYRIRTASGEIKWVLERGDLLYSHDRHLIGLEGFIADITERILAQQLLEQRVVDRTRKLSALYQVMTLAAEQSDLKTILQEALSWVLKAVHGEAGVIHLLEQAAYNLHLAVHEALPAEMIEHLEQLSPIQGLAADILETSVPYITPDIQKDYAVAHLVGGQFHSYAGVRIHARGHTLGILSIFRKNERLFSEGDTALLVSVADQIGTAVENAHLRQENERLLVLDERNRLARELHDAVTQSLYSLTLFAEVNQRYARAGDMKNVAAYSQRIEETAEKSLREMRLLLHNLRPSILQDVGLVSAVQQRLDAVEKRAGIATKLVADDTIILPSHVEESLFHITEEALNNSLKHAQATAVTVKISQSQNQVNLIIQDNGCGFDITNLSDSGGIGLASMQERAKLLGGDIHIHSIDGSTQIIIHIDLDNLRETTDSQTLLDLL